MDTLALAERMLDRQLEWVRTADAKVAPVFAVDAAMLGVLGVRLPHLDEFSFAVAVVWGLAAAALLLSLICLGLVALPRLDGPKESLFFFGTAAKIEAGDYIARLLATDEAHITEDVARQAHRNAEIAATKFAHLKNASLLMFAALPLWLLAITITRNIGQ
ncbi:MAG: hypothetical protein H3C62_09590 [Gemmatimonadaceae bacterium]|nr:hypothetical protein [Gemmatimonadaceae bacterium]